MRITCPSCAAAYDVPEGAIGPNGRRIRCRACDTSWTEPPRSSADSSTPGPPAPPVPFVAPPLPPAPEPVVESAALPTMPNRRRSRVPWLLLALGAAVVGLGGVAAVLAFGPDQVASRLGLADHRSPLGIAINGQPDWRLIAGGSQLFVVSGRIWNPTAEPQVVPDIRAELKDAAGRTVYAWTIARPVARLAPGAAATFDGAAVDVPATSAKVGVSFAGLAG
jgi:predicted Zn finger-like uncharacterized protein